MNFILIMLMSCITFSMWAMDKEVNSNLIKVPSLVTKPTKLQKATKIPSTSDLMEDVNGFTPDQLNELRKHHSDIRKSVLAKIGKTLLDEQGI